MADVARWVVSGRVQGVGFRWFVCGAARRHEIRGDVRNLRDGGVEIRAQGSEVALAGFLDDIRRGPAGSRVDAVERLPAEEGMTFDGFDVRY